MELEEAKRIVIDIRNGKGAEMNKGIQAIDTVLNELDNFKNKCKEYDTKICPNRYIQGQVYMENKILTIINQQKEIYKYNNNKPKIIAIEELLKKLAEQYIK